jgi:hypothetical protein
MPKTLQARSSAPQSFTLRDLSRQPAKVLAACDLYGVARIRTRDGRSYCLKPEIPELSGTAQVESVTARRQRLRQQLRAAGFVPPSSAEIERVNHIVAGEE